MDNDNLYLSIIDRIKEASPTIGKMFEVGFDYAPYVSRVLQTIKLIRLERRFNEHKTKFDRIAKLASETKLSADYINQRIFPIVITDLIEEHEDAKITLILNGYENVFINESTNESIIINYSDTLRGLRYADIMRFFYLANATETYSFYPRDSEENALVRNIDNKLDRLGLIKIFTRVGESKGLEFDTDKDKINLTMYGDRFLRFILESEALLEVNQEGSYFT